MILSSQKVNELDKNAMEWSMRITGVDISVDKEMFGWVEMIKAMADSNNRENNTIESVNPR